MIIRFEDIYAEYFDRLFSYIMKRLGNVQETEDLLQEVFLSCFQNLDRFDETRASVSTWLFVITNNKLKNKYRDRKDTVSLNDKENPFDIPFNSCMQEAVEFEEDKVLLFRAMEQLNEREQKIVEETYFHEKTSAQIAEELCLSAGNVRVILNRCRKKMGQYMTASGYEIVM